MATTDSGGLRFWAQQVGAWAVPEEIRAAALQPPHGFDVERFARIADLAVHEDTPSERSALEVLAPGGSVLDVGCGAGAGSLPLAPPASRLTGVDRSAEMLEAFSQRARARGARWEVVQGHWPEVAGAVSEADVVVCHNVLYGVTDLGAFVTALTAKARLRVVVEITREHPTSWLNPYWWHLHGVERPSGPTAEDAVHAIREVGLDVQAEPWERPMTTDRTIDDRVAFVRARLCVGPERDPEIRALFDRHPPPSSRGAVTLWWDAR